MALYPSRTQLIKLKATHSQTTETMLAVMWHSLSAFEQTVFYIEKGTLCVAVWFMQGAIYRIFIDNSDSNTYRNFPQI